jgi:hypothetical protein
MTTYHMCVLGENSPRVTIEVLPDEILLKLFDFCQVAASLIVDWPKQWQMLVHICQRWQYIIFSSPLGLDLCLRCSDRTSVRKLLEVWPPFPIEIRSFNRNLGDNIIAALEHHDHIWRIYLSLAYHVSERLAKVMQKPFPSLTTLDLLSDWEDDGSVLVLPSTFLGGSTPCLQSLTLKGVAFPTLPQLLLSCKDLSKLELGDIPDPGYISPEAMVTGLSNLTRLTQLDIQFRKSATARVRGQLPAARIRKLCCG